jgi:mitochondrial import inner membrane translocase subunit TIM50
LRMESMIKFRFRYLKDLRYINRPINRIVVVDSNQARLEKCYENSIVLSEFQGTKDDNTLLELLPLLERTKITNL